MIDWIKAHLWRRSDTSMHGRGETWFPTFEAQGRMDSERRFDDAIRENSDARAELRQALQRLAEPHYLERALMRSKDDGNRPRDAEANP